MGDRSVPKPFEPPPWEKDQFDDLARKRAETEDDEDITTALKAIEGEGGLPPVAPESHMVGPAPEEAKSSNVAGVKELPPETDLLLSRLKEQEPEANGTFWKIGLVFAALVGVIGLVLIVWGVTGLFTGQENGAVALVGGAIMIFFGMLFAGVAAWLTVRTMRQQGVL